MHNDSFYIYSKNTCTTPLTIHDNQHTLVIVRRKEKDHPQLRELLNKILVSPKQSLEKFAICSEVNIPYELFTTLRGHNIQNILIFGLNPHIFGLKIKEVFFRINLLAGIRITSYPSLQELQSDTEGKKKLWESLKKLYL